MNLEKEDLEDILSPMRKVGWSEEETAAAVERAGRERSKREPPGSEKVPTKRSKQTGRIPWPKQ